MTETKIWTPTGILLSTTGGHPFQLSKAGKGINISQLVNLLQPGENTIEALLFGESVSKSVIAVTQATTNCNG